MNYTTLISPAELDRRLTNSDWAIIDCRFSLDDTDRGRRDYEDAHIPGASYAHLDDDLSGLIVPGKSGRHPLPEIDIFSQTLARWGIGAGVQVVAYDDSGGAIAARLWWMLRWLNHDAVAVLDGGWPRWLRESRPVRTGVESRTGREFTPRPRPEMLIDSAGVEEMRENSNSRLIDSRAAERYQGENEIIDPVAGHIPGAISGPYADNLDAAGLFLSQKELRARFEAILAGASPEQAAFYCGSGVTAAHNLLAMVYAGYRDARLYAGSWSEWITDPARPVATGRK